MPEGFKIICQLDDNDYLVGAAHAFENPVRPGSHLIPGGAIDQPAPVVPEGKWAKRVGTAWVFEDLPALPGVQGQP